MKLAGCPRNARKHHSTSQQQQHSPTHGLGFGHTNVRADTKSPETCSASSAHENYLNDITLYPKKNINPQNILSEMQSKVTKSINSHQINLQLLSLNVSLTVQSNFLLFWYAQNIIYIFEREIKWSIYFRKDYSVFILILYTVENSYSAGSLTLGPAHFSSASCFLLLFNTICYLLSLTLEKTKI